MPTKDYYVILGISRTESSKGVRSAFRDLARRYHPDRAGPGGTRFFQDLLEAYRVLSNAEHRASYDQGLRHAEGGERIAAARVTPAQAPRSAPEPTRPEPEPLIPDQSAMPAPISLMRDFEVTTPSWDEVFNRFLQNFTQPYVPPTRDLDALNLQIRIGTRQAARGGVITLTVPVFYPCPRCRGRGSVMGHACRSCGESGMIEEEEPVSIRIPSMVRHGTVFEVPLRGLGINNLYLRIRILVGDPP